MHKLRRKKAVNELLDELQGHGVSEDPRADKDWVNPWAQKGTEVRVAAGGKGTGRKHAEIEMHTAPRQLPPRHEQRTLLDDDAIEPITSQNVPAAPADNTPQPKKFNPLRMPKTFGAPTTR